MQGEALEIRERSGMLMTDYPEILWKGRRDWPSLVCHLFVEVRRISKLDEWVRGELL